MAAMIACEYVYCFPVRRRGRVSMLDSEVCDISSSYVDIGSWQTCAREGEDEEKRYRRALPGPDSRRRAITPGRLARATDSST